MSKEKILIEFEEICGNLAITNESPSINLIREYFYKYRQSEIDELNKSVKYYQDESDHWEKQAIEGWDKAKELEAEVERLKGLITKYITHVEDCEGIDFLGLRWKRKAFTEFEWNTLQELRPKY